MTKETSYKDFEEWYTEVFGGHITEEQANDTLRVAYDYYVDNRKLTVKNTELEAYNEKLLTSDIEKYNKIVELESQLIKAVKLLKRCYDDWVYLPPLRTEIEEFLEEI